MAEDEERLEQLVMLFSSMQRYLPDRVAEFVEPFVGIDRWREHFASLILHADVGTSRRFLDLRGRWALLQTPSYSDQNCRSGESI